MFQSSALSGQSPSALAQTLTGWSAALRELMRARTADYDRAHRRQDQAGCARLAGEHLQLVRLQAQFTRTIAAFKSHDPKGAEVLSALLAQLKAAGLLS